MRKTAYIGLFAALAIIFGYVDAQIPVFVFLGVPGIKLGLANLVTVFILYTYSYKEAAMISVIRIIVIGFLFGNLFSILFSLAGAGLSLGCMIAAKKFSDLSVAGVSIVGGVAHNLGQIVIAALVVENVNIFYYFPVLLISGMLTGMLIGVVASEVQKRIQGRISR